VNIFLNHRLLIIIVQSVGGSGGESGFDSGEGEGFYLSKAFTVGVRPIQPPAKCLLGGALSPGLKRQEYEAEHYLIPRLRLSEAVNVLHLHVCKAWCLITVTLITWQ